MNGLTRLVHTKRKLLGFLGFAAFSVTILAAGILPSDAPPLIQACAAGDLAKVQQLIAQGANVNQPDANGATALMWAAKSGNLEIVKALVAKGADPKNKGIIWRDEKKDTWYGSLLAVAAGEGHGDVVQFAIDSLKIPVNDAEITTEGKEEGDTSLGCAAGVGNVVLMRYLLSKGAKPNYRNFQGFTALHYAAIYHPEAIGVLLKAGAVVNAASTDENGRFTPLIVACCENAKDSPASVSALLAVGADVNAKDKYGWTALHYAARNHPEAIGVLLKAGAAVNAASTDENGRVTPLMVACWEKAKDSPVSVRALLAAGADVNAKDKYGWTALHNAARYHPEAIGVLLKAGAVVNAASTDENGRLTPLIVACCENAKDSPASVSALLAAGADVNAKDKDGWTALHYAARYHPEAIGGLLKAGAVVNAASTDENGRLTPLIVACCENAKDSPASVSALLAAGADVKAKDKNGWTALHYAARMIRPESVEAVLKAGAYVDSQTKDGETALFFAVLPDVSSLMDNILGLEPEEIRGAAPTGDDAASIEKAIQRKIWEQPVQVARLIIGAGADVNKKNNNGETVLMRAAQKAPDTMIGLLLSSGARVHDSTSGWRTALALATFNGNASTVQALLAAGADARVRYPDGKGILDLAGSGECVRMLVAAGARPYMADNDGVTPLHRAALDGHLDVVKALLEAGAGLSPRAGGTKYDYLRVHCEKLDRRVDINLKTPLGCALLAGNNDVADFLRSKGAKE